MADSIETLKELALSIRNATKTGENTAERVGRTLVGIIENLSSIDIEELGKIFLRKDKEDTTNFLLNFLGGIKIGKHLTLGDFITNMQGGYIDEKGRAELESLVLRSELIVPAYQV